MKYHTYLVMYRPGPTWRQGQPMSQQPLQDHGRFLLKLYTDGLLTQAGPFSDDTGGGAVILAPNLTGAAALVDRDPAVQSGLFVYEVHPWALVPWAQHLERARRAAADWDTDS